MFEGQSPIAILAFNRPTYLKRVLESLKAQQGIQSDDLDIYLFQDGAVNAVSGKRHALDEDIAENIRLFSEIFPTGKVMASESNLGVALNFERAERLVFEKIEAPFAIFLEDDMELGPYYLKTMRHLAGIALKRSDIGYFAAYGNHRIAMEQQKADPNGLTTLGHNWAFGLTRAQWLKSAPYVNQYLALVRDVDYRERPTDKIADLFHAWGCGAPGTSQDVAKTLACHLTGSVKVNTLAAFGRYIGERGLHTTPEFFARNGFDKTQVMEDDVFTRDAVGEEDIARMRADIVKYCASEMPGRAKPAPSQPEDIPLRMTEAETEALKKRLKRSRHYLEFGCGGSTLLAVRNSPGHVVSVESDPGWIAKISEHPEIKKVAAGGRLLFHPVDIGPVKEWGIPKDDSRLRAWRNYYTSAWTARDFDYDLVLIDGRFRVMCALSAAIFAQPNTIVALHDYSNRKGYFTVEKYFDTVEHVDRLVFLRRRANINMKAWLLDFIDNMYDVS
jgi:hypothetical protein